MKLFFKKFNKPDKGFTLIETLIALLIFSLSVVAVMIVMGNGVSSTIYAKQKMTAELLAQEGIEYVRNERDTSVLFSTGGAQEGWDNFINSFTGNYPITDPNLTGYTRQVTLTSVGRDQVRISSTVTWSQAGLQKSVQFSEDLYKWIE